MPVCAEAFRLSLKNNVKDWIDGGSFLMYSLRFGYVAQSLSRPSGHPIVEV